MVRDGDTFFLQSGTTTGCMLRALKGRKNLTVLTNDLSHAILAEELLVDSEVILLGGQLRFGYHYTQGNETIRLLNEYFVPTAFMGTNTFSFSKRIYGASIGAGEHGERHRERCRPTHNPHGLIENRRHRLWFTALDLNEINCLITDTGVDADTRQRLAELAPNLEIIYA